MDVLVSHVRNLCLQISKADSRIELAWTNQMALWVSESHLGSEPEEEIRGKAFEQLFSPADADGAWQGCHAMNVVRLNIELVEGNLVALRRLHQTDGVKVFIVDLPKDLVAVFWAPFKGPEVDAICMAVAVVVGVHCISLQESSRCRKLFSMWARNSTCPRSL